MSKKDGTKLPMAFSEAQPDGNREINPPGYKKPHKFSTIMEKALLAVERMNSSKKSIH